MCINDPEPPRDAITTPLTVPAANALDLWSASPTARAQAVKRLARIHPAHAASLMRHFAESNRGASAYTLARALHAHAQAEAAAERFHVALSPAELHIVLAALDAVGGTTQDPAALDIAADLRFVALAEGVTNPAHGL